MANLYKFLLFVFIIVFQPASLAAEVFSVSEKKVVVDPPTVTGPSSVCSGNTVTLTASIPNSGTGTIEWFDVATGGTPIATGTSFTTPLLTTTATYYVQVSEGTTVSARTSKQIIVNPTPTISGGTNLCIGSTLQLTGSGSANTTAPWTSSNPGIAIVNTSGLVTGMSSGTVDIIYKNSFGCSSIATLVVHALPVSSFTVEPGIQCATEEISFTNTSTGTNLTYQWDFGNPSSGSLNTSQNVSPTHIFIPNPGNATQTFTVKLTVTNTVTNCSQVSTQTVTVKQLPDALLAGPGSSIYNDFPTFKVCQNGVSSLTFGNASTTTATNTNYIIDWGDSTPIFSSSTFSSTISHSYAVGLHTLTYTVTGQNGCSIVKVYKVFVGSNPAVSLGNPGNTDICLSGVPTSDTLIFPINNTQNNAPGTTYTVTFSDDPANPITYNHPPPTEVPHIYTATSCGSNAANFQNSFSATIVARNPCSQSQVSVVPIYISTKPQPSFTMQSTSACVNSSTCFTNTTQNSNSIDASDGSCNHNAPSVWSITPNTGYTINSGSSLGFILDPNDPTSWVSGTSDLCVKFTTAGTYTIKLKAGNKCGVTSEVVKTICIESAPTAGFTVDTNSGCAPLTVQATNTTVVTNSCSPTYNWSVAYAAGNCGTSSGSGFFASGSSATSVSPAFNFQNAGTYTITLTVNTSCGPVTSVKTVTVKQKPTVTVNVPSTVCGGATVTPSATVSDCGSTTPSTYAWTFQGGSPATSASLNPGTITFATPGAHTIALSVTNECGTTTDTKNITISETPTLNPIANQDKCAGQMSDAITFSGTGTGVTYAWSNSNTSIGLGASGNGSGINAFQLLNTTATVQQATITVTPKTGSCTGAAQTFTITVNPKATVNNISSMALCHNATSAAVNFSGNVATATYSWVNDNTSIGLAANGTGNLPSFTAVNTGTAPAIATITVTPMVNGCPGTPKTFTITVNPLPAPITVTNKDLCHNMASGAINFGNAATTTYSWTNSDPSIGLAASGTGNIASFTATNTTNTIKTATITVTPTSNGCVGAPQSFTITVSPSPVVTFSQPSQTVCSGNATTAVSLTSATAGATFTWTAVVPAGVSGPTPNGTDTIPVQTLVNNTNAPLTVTYKATAAISGGPGCAGAEYNYTITINPRPRVANTVNTTTCSGTAFTATPVNGTGGNIIPAGTTYTWGAPVINPANAITGGGEESSPKISVSQLLTNTTAAPAIATYTVTPVANGCAGTPFTVVVTVNPNPAADAVAPINVCGGTSVGPVNFTGNFAGITYTWTNSDTSIGLASGGMGDLPAFTALNATDSPKVATITVIPSANGCTGTSRTFTITVNPAPSVNFSQTNQVICSGASSVAVTLSSTTSGAALSWTAASPAGITGMGATSGNLSIPAQTLINNTSSPITITYTAKAATTGVTCPGPDATYTITVNPVPSVTTAQTATICSGQAFTITPADGGGNSVPAGTTYTWTAPAGSNISGGSTQATGVAGISQTLTNTTNVPVTATYTVTPKLGNCSGTPFTATVTINPTPVVANTTKVVCSGEAFDINPASIAGNNVPAGTTYTWGIPTVPSGIAGEAAGTDLASIGGTLTNSTNAPLAVTYTIVPKSPIAACTGATFTLTVTVNPVPAISPIAIPAVCSNTGFTVLPTDGTNGTVPAGTTYTWGAPAISPAGAITGGAAQPSQQAQIGQSLLNTTSAVATATYTVTPKSGNCTGNTFTVTVPVNPVPTVNTLTNQTLCNGNMTTAVPFSGAVAGTIYNWSNNTPAIGLPASGSGDIAAFAAINNSTTPVTATITVTPQFDGCNGQPKTFTITVNPAPSVTFSQPDQSICSGTSSAAVNLTSATPGTSFNWTATVPAGVTGVATSGTNTIPAQNLVNTTPNPVIIEYVAIAQTTGVACPGAPVIYRITVTPVPFVSTAQQQTVCSGTAFNVLPSDGAPNNVPPGTTFTWTMPSGSGFTGASAQATPVNTISQTLVNTTTLPVTAVYTVTPRFNSCAGVPFTVTVTVNPTAVIADTAVTICTGGSFTINPALISGASIPAGTTYSWGVPIVTGGLTGGTSGTDPNTISGTLTNSTTATQTATYTVTPLSPIGTCAGDPFNVVVTVRPQLVVTPQLSNFNGFEISTAGGNDGWINLSPAGGSGSYTYSWTGPNGFTSSAQNITGLTAGTYIATISDGLCSNVVLTLQVREPLPLVIQEVVAGHINVNCYGQSTGAIEVAITQVSIAPFDYILNLQGGGVVQTIPATNALTYTFNSLPAGTYYVQVRDANGTVKTVAGIIVTQPASGLAISNAAVSSHNGFSITCNGANDGSIDLNVSGGYPAYTYAWTGPNGFAASTEDISGLAPGLYTVVIGDTTPVCTITQSYTITEPQPLTYTGTISSFNGYSISCNGGNNGTITIVPAGGSGTYTYQWAGPNGFTATTQNLSGLYAGTYTLTVTDSNGCINSSGVYTLTEPPAMGITESHTDLLCYGASTGSINVNVIGGVPAYSYAWTGPNGFISSSQNLSNIPAGAYTLVVTDASGCSKNITVTLVQPTEIIIIPTTTPITCYGANNASISLAISGGVGIYSIAWDNLATGTYQNNLAAGNYVITVTDSNGCNKIITVNIPEAPIFTIYPVKTDISCHGANDGSIVLNLVGGQAPVSLVWADGSTAGTARYNLPAGTYSVTITDGTPCYINRSFTILEPNPLSVSGQITHALDCTNASGGAVNLIVAGGTPPFAYSWSNGAITEDIANLTSGTYAVAVTDSRGCTVNKQFTVTRPQPLTLDVSSNVTFNCNTNYVNQVNTAQAAGGMPPYVYSWSSGTVSGAQGQNMTTNQNGTVIATVTDVLGCTATISFEVDTRQLGNPSFTATSYGQTTYSLYAIFDPILFTNTSTGDFTQVAWDFGDGSVSNEINPEHTYLREGTYIVKQTVVYPYGCTKEVTYTIVIEKGYDVMLPNGFTPNGDGINEEFNVQHRGLKSLKLDVYDTWGSLIYHEEGETLQGWNGTIGGVPAENGNYYYKVEVEIFYGHKANYEGPLVLIK